MWLLAIAIFVTGMLAMLVFLVSKTLSIVAKAAFRSIFNREPPNWLSPPSIGSTLVLASTFLLLRACEHQQVELYKKALPSKIDIKELIYHDQRSDLREGCGEAIFRVSEATIMRIKREGLSFFKDATIGRDGDSYHKYAEWRMTPSSGNSETDRLLRGASCIDNPPAVWDEIGRSIHSKGSYYTTGSEQDIVVIPDLGIVVFSHNG